MKIKKWVHFDGNNEKNEFLGIIRNSRTEMEAIQRVMQKYSLDIYDAQDAVNNFIKEIGHDLP